MPNHKSMLPVKTGSSLSKLSEEQKQKLLSAPGLTQKEKERDVRGGNEGGKVGWKGVEYRK